MVVNISVAQSLQVSSRCICPSFSIDWSNNRVRCRFRL